MRETEEEGETEEAEEAEMEGEVAKVETGEGTAELAETAAAATVAAPAEEPRRSLAQSKSMHCWVEYSPSRCCRPSL